MLLMSQCDAGDEVGEVTENSRPNLSLFGLAMPYVYDDGIAS